MANELPLATGHVAWVAARLGRPLTRPEQELVTIVCAALHTGPWNVHRDWSILRSDPHAASIHIERDLATYDASALTRLVLAAHDRCCRASVHPSGPRGLRICVCTRCRDGDRAQRHPTIEAVVEAWRGEHAAQESEIP